jgi:outer membrane protein TolC
VGDWHRVAVTAALIGLLWAAAPARGAGMERITLQQAIARALARYPDVLAAAAEVRRAEALVIQARSDALPTLLPSGSYNRLDADRRFMSFVVQAKDQWNATAPLTVPLFAPRAWAQWAHARDDRQVSTLNLRQVQRQVGIAVANAYLTVVTMRRTLEIALVGRDNAAAHADFTRQQAAAGTVNELDAVRAQQQLHTTLAQVEAARISLLRAQEALGVLVAGDHPIDAAEAPQFVLPGPTSQPQMRADVLWLKSRQLAAQHRVKDSYTDYLPRLTGIFQPMFTEPATFAQPRWGWQLTLNLIVPLYDGGLRSGTFLENRALLDQASDMLAGTLRQASSDIRLGHEAVVHADARVRETRKAAELARRALDISTLRYRHGATSNLEVIDAEQEARQSDLAAALAEDSAQQVRLDLLAASGGFP